MTLHAADVIALLDHLGWTDVRFVGLVGMGACIAQEVAIARSDLVRSMVNMGAWASVDTFLYDQLTLFAEIHRDAGFWAFQKLVTVMSFLPEYYNANKDKLLGTLGWLERTKRQLRRACALCRRLFDTRHARPVGSDQGAVADHSCGPGCRHQSTQHTAAGTRHSQRRRGAHGRRCSCRRRARAKEPFLRHFARLLGATLMSTGAPVDRVLVGVVVVKFKLSAT